MLRRYGTAVLLLVLAMVVAACSGTGSRSTDQRAVNAALDGFIASFSNKDTSVFTDSVEVSTRSGSSEIIPADEVWDHLLREYFNGVSSAGLSAFAAADEAFTPRLDDRKIVFSGNEASVTGRLSGGQEDYPVRMALKKQGANWRIYRILIMLLSGDWAGTWASDIDSRFQGPVNVTFTQNGLELGGTVTVGEAPCFGEGTLTGQVSGDRTLFGTLQGDAEIRYESTVLTPWAIEGKYWVTGGPLGCQDRGTFSITRN